MFKKAERTQVKPKIAITGPSGSGKTMGALILAQSLGKKIAVIDTENGSASTYADRFAFDTLVIRPPYTVDKYVAATEGAIHAKYDVLVIDSLSHAWAGEGGLLQRKEELDSRPGSNHFANWMPITKQHEQFKSLILNADIAIVATMRSKQDYVLGQNDKGKQAPEKVGLAPVQREGMEYEFMTVFDVDMTHQVTVSKDRTSLFDGKRFKITKKIGEELAEWLRSAKPAAEANPAPAPQAQPAAPAAAPAAPALGAEVPTDKTSGVACMKCGAELRLHGNRAGYICPNAKEKADGHQRVLASQLQEFRAKQPFKPQHEVTQGI